MPAESRILRVLPAYTFLLFAQLLERLVAAARERICCFCWAGAGRLEVDVGRAYTVDSAYIVVPEGTALR